MLNRLTSFVGRWLADYLERPAGEYRSYASSSRELLQDSLQPGDVLLVEGNSRVSGAIKYLTQSTWSHAAFFVGHDRPGAELIEADLSGGVHTVALSVYANFNTRICRPVGLEPDEIAQLVAYMQSGLGRRYDLRNIVDLARYLLPQPPVPRRWRRRMLALGSGDPTRAICSTLIAEAFQSVRYPILPEIRSDCPGDNCAEILHIRHHSLFAPRDFDVSPYFRVVKPTIEQGFDPHALQWSPDEHIRPKAVSPQPNADHPLQQG